MTNTLIEIRDLRVGFAGREVVHGVNLDIRRGECLALVGESGSGKSVTAHSILRLLPGKDVQTQGSIRYDGIDLVSASDAQLRGLRGNRIDHGQGRVVAVLFRVAVDHHRGPAGSSYQRGGNGQTKPGIGAGR